MKLFQAISLFILVFLNFNPVSAKALTVDAAAAARTPHLSANWSGYAADNGQFTAVSGSWIVPDVKTSKDFKTDSTWIGIGGVKNQDLIQTGTESFTGQSGDVSYGAWYELLPDFSVSIPVDVSAGDLISASVSRISGSKWKISLSDLTSRQSFEKIVSYNSSLSSAEWIEEAPSSLSGILPLDNFGRVEFKNANVVKNGKKVSLSELKAEPIAIGGPSGKVLAAPGKVKSSGGFEIIRSLKNRIKRIFRNLSK